MKPTRREFLQSTGALAASQYLPKYKIAEAATVVSQAIPKPVADIAHAAIPETYGKLSASCDFHFLNDPDLFFTHKHGDTVAPTEQELRRVYRSVYEEVLFARQVPISDESVSALQQLARDNRDLLKRAEEMETEEGSGTVSEYVDINLKLRDKGIDHRMQCLLQYYPDAIDKGADAIRQVLIANARDNMVRVGETLMQKFSYPLSRIEQLKRQVLDTFEPTDQTAISDVLAEPTQDQPTTHISEQWLERHDVNLGESFLNRHSAKYSI